MNTNIIIKTSVSSKPAQAHDIAHLQNWIELSTSAVEHNALQFKQWLGISTQIAGVIKSNAYGHGLIEMATLYEQCKNIAALCVINSSEAICIRQRGITKPIFVIGYIDTLYDTIPQHDIQVVLYDLQVAHELNEIGKKYNKKINIHIKFDTGMSRLGIVADQLETFVKQLVTLHWITIAGIFSHLAESYKSERTHNQESVFTIIEQLQADQILPDNLAVHISNSHGSLTTKHKNYSYARIGIGLYGYLQKHAPEIQTKLQPVLSLKTKILQIKSVVAGSLIGYDGMFQAPHDMTIATIAIGYHEGLDARLSNCGSVIINGHFTPIIGRICMNLTIIDITNISGCRTGQVVTILGKEGDISISAYDWSAITKASVYNHLTKLSNTLPKIIVL
ncbi:MAG: alanine racemase [Candidatus Chromulinivorax sp.]|nr:alanine racemase [Candidatus Chromulinivorax sp.]